MSEAGAQGVDDELRVLSAELSAERRRAARSLRSRSIGEAPEQRRRRCTSEALSLARRAARCRSGPKNKDGRLAQGPPPSREEWLYVWQAPG
eukprot:8747657-Pyramimonas_sp.AAC.1